MHAHTIPAGWQDALIATYYYLQDDDIEPAAQPTPKRRRGHTQQCGRRGAHLLADSDDDSATKGVGIGRDAGAEGVDGMGEGHAARGCFQGEVLSVLSSSDNEDGQQESQGLQGSAGKKGKGGRLRRGGLQDWQEQQAGKVKPEEDGTLVMSGPSALPAPSLRHSAATTPQNGGDFGAEQDTYDPDALEDLGVDDGAAPPSASGRRADAGRRGVAAGAAGSQQRKSKRQAPSRKASATAGRQRQSRGGDGGSDEEEEEEEELEDEEYDGEEDAGAQERSACVDANGSPVGLCLAFSSAPPHIGSCSCPDKQKAVHMPPLQLGLHCIGRHALNRQAFTQKAGLRSLLGTHEAFFRVTMPTGGPQKSICMSTHQTLL
eukprot:1072107-Pelagomonas_calceolata.AAC.1